MRKWLSAVLSLVMLAMPMASLAGQEADRTKMSKSHQKVYDATLALYGTYNGVTHFLCTTTVVAQRASQPHSDEMSKKYEYLLLTAGHCIKGDGLPEGLVFSVSDTVVPEDDAKDRQPVTVVKATNNTQFDFAILHLESDQLYPWIPINMHHIPKIEDKVYVVNYSLGFAKQIAKGYVATDVMTSGGARPQECDICGGRYMVHLFAGPGASGSAIIDDKTDEIIGVGEFGFPDQTLGLGVETTEAFRVWLTTPEDQSLKASPKAQSPRNGQAQQW